MSDALKIHTQGAAGELLFDPQKCRCGNIFDGVSFQIANEGWWVISFDDLEKIYLAAKEAR